MKLLIAWTIALFFLIGLAIQLRAQSAASPLVQARQQFFDAVGRPLAYGKIYTYQAGSSTPQSTFADSTGSLLSQNTNPVILDAGGYASIYVRCGDPAYKIIVKDSANVIQWSEDGVQYPGCTGSGMIIDINGLTVNSQSFATGTNGLDFNISSDLSTHTFNLPTASATARGAMSTGAQIFGGNKSFLGDVDVSTLTITGPDVVLSFDELDCSGVSPVAGVDTLCADQTTLGMKLSNNGDAFLPILRNGQTLTNSGVSLTTSTTVGPTVGNENVGLFIANNRTAAIDDQATITAVEGVSRSRNSGKELTIRGGHFRTYIDDTLSGTAITSVGIDGSARASGSVVADPGTAFVGIRSYMAPGFTGGTLGNVTNFHAFWAYNESATQAVTNAYYASAAAGGFTNGVNLSGTTIAATGGQLITSLGQYIYSGTQTTRNAIRTEVGTTGAIGSIYLSTSGEIFLKVATGGADTDWELITTSARDSATSILANLGTPANGTIIYCTNCDTPASPGATCSAAGDTAGAEAHRIRGGWNCF